MRVTHIITNLGTGGAEMMLFKLLSHIDRSRFDCSVISLVGMSDIGPRIAALGIPVQTAGMTRGGVPSPLALLRLRNLLAAQRPDIVHTWMYHADLLGGLAARSVGCQRIVWGLRNSNTTSRSTGLTTSAVMHTCARLSRRVPLGILSCSERGKHAHAAVGYDEARIDVIPNGFDLGRFQPHAEARTTVRAELGLPPDTPLVGVVGRYHPLKNHLGFLSAAAEVRARHPDARFLLAGRDVDTRNTELTRAIAKRDLGAHVILLGPRDDVPRLMASLDVLASPSHSEGFPNVIGEAMACGVPCAVTDAGDSAEIVADTGRVVPVGDMRGLADALSELLSLPTSERQALGEAAARRVRTHYEIGDVVRRFEAYYERVLAGDAVR